MSKTVNGYQYELSTAKGKKLMTTVKGETIHFGNIDYEHYQARTAKIKRKDGTMTANDPMSPNFHSRNVLW
jgi:predicted metal-dependent phosphoesterase TrpH